MPFVVRLTFLGGNDFSQRVEDSLEVLTLVSSGKIARSGWSYNTRYYRVSSRNLPSSVYYTVSNTSEFWFVFPGGHSDSPLQPGPLIQSDQARMGLVGAAPPPP